MNKFFATICAACLLMSGCGGNDDKTPPPTPAAARNAIDLSNARDGTYSAESSRDEKLGKSVLTLTIKDKKIVAAEFTSYDLLGNVKDEEYGAIFGKDSGDYKKAQVAVKAIKDYATQLVEKQDLNKVDAISGASISYSQFVETTKHAVKEATR